VPRRLFVGVLVAVAALAVAAGAMAAWATVFAARLDLAAAQDTPLVFAAGRAIRPGVAIRAVSEALDRLHYRPVTGAPPKPGEFRRSGGRWDIHLRAPEGGAEPARVVRLRVEGPWITEVAGATGSVDASGVALEPELLTGVGDTGLERRRPVALGDMSPFLPAAVLAAEDHRFFDHLGLDVVAVARAVVANVTRGGITQGASTLTQQLVKNLALRPERTWRRKILEGALALAIERRYDKEQILEAYLNTVYLGQRGRAALVGVGAAAQSFWGKDARRLGLAESALLAGIIRAPNRYSPEDHPARARQRRDAVLRRMHELGMIDKQALEAALAERTTVRAGTTLPSQAPYFLDHVRATAGDLEPGRTRVYTTLDPGLQRAAEAAVARGLDRLESAHRGLRRSASGERLQAALVAIDPATGEIRAMVGGRDYQLSPFNRVTRARRQPGSAFKPFVFLAALRRGPTGEPPSVTPASVVEDLPIEIAMPQDAWAPRNFEDRFDGLITVRQALERSSNSVAVRLAQTAGLDNVVRTAREAGFTSRMAPVPALALGSFEVTPLELARAYATLANGGTRVAPHGIRLIEGRPRAARAAARASGVPSAFFADELYLVTDLLRSVVDRGTGAAVRALGLEGAVAGKTGTTNDTRDAWFAGYSPRLVAVVWVGFDDGTPLGLSGAGAALPIWTDFMRAAAAVEDPGDFAMPSTLVVRRPCDSPVPEMFLPLTAPSEICAAPEPATPFVGPGGFPVVPAAPAVGPGGSPVVPAAPRVGPGAPPIGPATPGSWPLAQHAPSDR
jgi:penicillin-binding protein 1B